MLRCGYQVSDGEIDEQSHYLARPRLVAVSGLAVKRAELVDAELVDLLSMYPGHRKVPNLPIPTQEREIQPYSMISGPLNEEGPHR